MRKHTKIYLDFFGYKIPEDCFCEICQSPAVDIHHIDARGMGGDPQGKKDVIENLMAVCRHCHENYGDVPECMDALKEVHMKKVNARSKELKNAINNVYRPINVVR